MLIDDLIVLGRACPEPLKDGRVTVCLAGWSDAYGFIRVYPTRTDMPWSRWDCVCVEVERSPTDSRQESWKIAGSKSDWDMLGNQIKVVGRVEDRDSRRNLLAGIADEGMQTINAQQRSLGVLKPEIIKTYFSKNRKYDEIWQMGLPGLTEFDEYKVKRNYLYEPRIRFTYPGCQIQQGYHDFQVLEWGFYEWVRKNPDKKEQVWENAHIGDSDWDIYFLVGNQLAYRTSFMIVSVLRVKSGPTNLPLIPFRKQASDN